MPTQNVCLPATATLLWHNEAATQDFARALAKQAVLRQALIELRGELGSGKSTFVRHLLRALGVPGRIKSPTYTVAECYSATQEPQLPIWHFDFYRFNDPQEWQDAGFRDIFASPGLKLVEWPDKAQGQLPPADLVLQLTTIDETARQVTLHAHSARALALLPAI